MERRNFWRCAIEFWTCDFTMVEWRKISKVCLFGFVFGVFLFFYCRSGKVSGSGGQSELCCHLDESAAGTSRMVLFINCLNSILVRA